MTDEDQLTGRCRWSRPVAGCTRHASRVVAVQAETDQESGRVEQPPDAVRPPLGAHTEAAA